MPERLVIIGGDAAGMSAAAQARRRASAHELEIIAFERGEYTSYSACGLPYFVADDEMDAEHLVARSPEEHRAQGIDVRLRHEVVGIDLDARTVTVRDLAGGRELTEGFDHLVIATGASPIRPDLPGVDSHGIHGIQNLTDGIDLRAHVVRHGEPRAVVVGCGYIGIEMAEALHRRGLHVTVLERDAQPMSTLDPDMGALVADAIRNTGIELRENTLVEGFETDSDNHVRAVVTTTGAIEADIVVLGIGVRPNATLAAAAGVAIGTLGGVVVDRRMATSADGVWAAGDCVEVFHRITRRPATIALGTHANKQGRIAGTNITGGYAAFPGVIGTAITKVCEYEVARTGLNEKEARRAGFEYLTATIESTTRARYMPDVAPITIKVLAEKGTRRLLGAQVIGREGAAKRIDVLALAIWNEMTADEFGHVDLAYAPPFSPVWDPTLVAARAVVNELNR